MRLYLGEDMRALFILVILLSFSAHGSSVYKCTVNGVTTFSQTPCDDQFETIDVDSSSGKSQSKADEEAVQKECLAYHKPKFDLPSTIELVSAKKVWINDSSGARQVLILDLNARDKYGAFTGAKPYKCFLNHDGSTLSKVQYLIQ